MYLDEPVLTAQNPQHVHGFTPEGTQNHGLRWWALALATLLATANLGAVGGSWLECKDNYLC